jgi:ribonucleoside-triphosphate reductase (formate)
MTVKKRDGSLVLFKVDKIIEAIEKAFLEVDGEIYEHDTASDIAYEIGKIALQRREPMSVEEIQD